MFKGKMVTPATPERVYTLCKIVEKNPITIADLREKMEPQFLQNNTVYFNDYKTAAEELGLISISDNLVSLAVEPRTIHSIESMRTYINSILEEFRDGDFYLVTHAFFGMEQNILNADTNVANWTTLMSRKVDRQINAMEMRAWRFWASFLGFGYLHDMFLIPNADVFLEDLICNANLEKNKRYSFGDFIENIRPQCDIVLDTASENHTLNFGFSNGLRTLHDAGVIKLEHILDQEDIWSLYPLDMHVIQNTVTNITICR